MGQVREPGCPTSHLVPCHSVYHVHLTEEKRWRSWAPDSHGLRDHKGQTKVQRGLCLPLSCTTSWKNNSPGFPPPEGAQSPACSVQPLERTGLPHSLLQEPLTHFLSWTTSHGASRGPTPPICLQCGNESSHPYPMSR